jgi:hypothetical protein
MPNTHFLIPVNGIETWLVPAHVFNSDEETAKLRGAIEKHAQLHGVKDRVRGPRITHKFNPHTRRIEPVEDSPRVFFKASDNSIHSVPADQIDAAKEIDPNLEVFDPTEQ